MPVRLATLLGLSAGASPFLLVGLMQAIPSEAHAALPSPARFAVIVMAFVFAAGTIAGLGGVIVAMICGDE